MISMVVFFTGVGLVGLSVVLAVLVHIASRKDEDGPVYVGLGLTGLFGAVLASGGAWGVNGAVGAIVAVVIIFFLVGMTMA